MNTSKTQRTITLINEERDNYFINPGYSPVFQMGKYKLTIRN